MAEAAEGAAAALRDHIVICGTGNVGVRVLEELLDAGQAVALVSRQPSEELLDFARAHGVPLVEGTARHVGSLRRAGVERARCVLALTDNDLTNVEIALSARELNPQVRLVLRIFDEVLARRLRDQLGIGSAFGISSVAAPAFVAAALGEDLLFSLHVDGKTVALRHVAAADEPSFLGRRPREVAAEMGELFIARRPEEGDPNAPLRAGEEIILASDAAHRAQWAHPKPSGVPSPEPPGTTVHRDTAWATLRRVRPGLLVTLAGLLSLLLLGIVVFHVTLDLSWVDAIYFMATIASTVGFGDINLLHAPPWVKLFGVLIMIASAALVAVVFTAIADAVVSFRLEQALGRRAHRAAGHVVVGGLGQVGYLAVKELLASGRPVVAVQLDDRSEFTAAVRHLCPVVVGDARQEQVLERAGIRRASAVLAVTNDDLANLGIALHAREVNPAVRVVLRIFNRDLARRVRASFPFDAVLSSSSLAAPSYAGAALHPRAIRTFRWGDRMYQIAWMRVQAGDRFSWGGAWRLDAAGGVAVLLHRPAGGGELALAAAGVRIATGDQVLVLASPEALEGVLGHEGDRPEP